ncbi:Pr6Pr family membrane protein [Actinoplanes sp. NPDC051861]|uniref:Pr6Pr family membrane protein n=1 Tax=Actinoplanes sp. NPDC051861 TaxID=3155170 RepID=UPI003428009E
MAGVPETGLTTIPGRRISMIAPSDQEAPTMSIYKKPQIYWRATIVACAMAGLLTGEHRIIFYTCQSNLIVIGYFIGTIYWMIQRNTTDTPAPRLRGPVTFWITITCLISHFVLNHGDSPIPGLTDPDPATRLTNWSLFLLHYVVPLMVIVDWAAFGPRRQVRWRDLPLWLLFPLGYGVTSVFRAILFPTVANRYPYPFLNPVEQGGYDGVALQMLILAVEFAVLASLVIGLDRLAFRLTGRTELLPAGKALATPTPDAYADRHD